VPFFSGAAADRPVQTALRRAVQITVNIGPAWLTLLASLGLALVGVHAIDLGAAPKPTHALAPMALKQLIYVGMGLLACLAMTVPRYRLLGALSWGLYAIIIAMLVFLLLPFVPTWLVRPRNGARGWIDLGQFDLQPSELAKIAWVLTIAWYLRFRKNHRTLRGLLPPAIITGVPVALITLEPDLGNAVLFIPALFAILVAAGAKLKHLALIVTIAAMAAPAAYPLLLPHQKARIVGMILQARGDASADQDINMQSVTAQRLVGAGEEAGVGASRTRTLVHFNALPERENDMVFAVVANRFGFLGGLAMIGMYAAWIVGAIWTAALCREPFGRLVPVGLAAFVGTQTFINIGMNLGLLPIIGITLPFVSQGGSSEITMWVMTGLILSIGARRPHAMLRHSFEYDDEK
jgi:rod shape determining protein RodA